MKVFGIAGYSGAGKTTLLETLIPCLVRRGVRVSVIKHAHHDADIDRPGKDTWRHRQAGASEVLLACQSRWALMHELRGAAEPALTELVHKLAPCDLVLVEGFKSEPFPKLEVFRAAAQKPPLYPQRPDIVAIACDTALDTVLPQLPLVQPEAIADFILAYLEIRKC